MRLGVIDVGSNTVHLLVVDAYSGAHPLPAVSHKIELRLAEHVTDDGFIADDGKQRLVDFVGECLALAEDHGVEQLLTIVTSAIRDAPNGEEVIEAVRTKHALDVTVMSGGDEARMTFLAARRWLGWSAGTLLVVDIGGGSLELSIGLDEEPDVALSLQLGAGRITRELLPGDPPSKSTIRTARRQVRAKIAAASRPILKHSTADRFVGTSKTLRSLARICGAAPTSDGPYVARYLKRSDVSDAVQRLAKMTAAERATLSGVSHARAPQMLAGAIIAEASMDLLGISAVEIVPWAMREGVILQFLDKLD